jgi:hypothetical protein
MVEGQARSSVVVIARRTPSQATRREATGLVRGAPSIGRQGEEPGADLGGRSRERHVLRGRVERFGMLGVFVVDRIGEGGGQTAVGPRSAVVLGWAARPPSMQRWTKLGRDESKSSQCDKPKKPRLLAREDDSDENGSSLGDRRSGAQVPPQEPTG